MKILLCFGTRPEAIKMAPVYFELKKRSIDAKVCVTGQHRNMLDQVLDFFEIVPDFDLDLMTENQSLNHLSGNILFRLDEILRSGSYDLVLVHGDTTTSTCAALASFHHKIPVGHIEAGLRTYNKEQPFPEEINRQLTARLADFHFAPTLKAMTNLLSENINEDQISVTGNTIVDAIDMAIEMTKGRPLPVVIQKVKGNDPHRKLVLVTCHRRENFGQGVENICEALLELSEKIDGEIIFPVHLNPNIQSTVQRILGNKERIHLVSPVSYPEMIILLKECDLIISDSGGIQEEAPSFGKQVLVLREFSERPEGAENGNSIMVGTDKDQIVLEAVKALGNLDTKPFKHNPFGDGKASERIVDFIVKRLVLKK